MTPSSTLMTPSSTLSILTLARRSGSSHLLHSKENFRLPLIEYLSVFVPHVHQPISTSTKRLATKLTFVRFQLEVNCLDVYLDLLKVTVAVRAESMLGV